MKIGTGCLFISVRVSNGIFFENRLLGCKSYCRSITAKLQSVLEAEGFVVDEVSVGLGDMEGWVKSGRALANFNAYAPVVRPKKLQLEVVAIFSYSAPPEGCALGDRVVGQVEGTVPGETLDGGRKQYSAREEGILSCKILMETLPRVSCCQMRTPSHFICFTSTNDWTAK